MIEIESHAGSRRAARRPGYEDYRIFPAKYRNQCSLCGIWLAAGIDVVGKRLSSGQWDILCLTCGTASPRTAGSAAQPRPAPSPQVIRPKPASTGRQTTAPAARSEWSTLVEYLRSCVLKEALVKPVPLNDHSRWAVLPVPAETVLCGNDLAVPLLPQLQALFTDLKPLEGVFYGWPTVVVLDNHHRPFVAPLFVRQLTKPRDAAVPVDDLLPQVNTGLLDMMWFSPESLTAATATIAGQAMGFGQASAVVTLAQRLLTALGVPVSVLDPTNLIDFADLGDPWCPQEPGAFNLAMARSKASWTPPTIWSRTSGR